MDGEVNNPTARIAHNTDETQEMDRRRKWTHWMDALDGRIGWTDADEHRRNETDAGDRQTQEIDRRRRWI